MIKKIEDFVSLKPRSVQEIASHLNKSWRTVDRYVEEIEKEFGTISIRVFRGGTRGALKVVYWASPEKIRPAGFQDSLEHDILLGRKKEDFSAFDIFQHVDSKKKQAKSKIGETEYSSDNLKDFISLLNQAKKQILMFSGNLSILDFRDKNEDVFKVLDSLVKSGVSVKVVCRVDPSGTENVERLLSLNFKYGKELVEVRHREQPLRVVIIDNQLASLKEIKFPTGKEKELKNKVFIFYRIKDKDWISWLSRIFWKMFNSSIGAEKRIKEMKDIK